MSAGELTLNAVFYVFALALVAGALGVAVSRNIVRSAFALLLVLFSVAAFYAIMRADFLFAAQVLIYVGGILVLIIFAVMLTHRITDVRISNESTPGPVAFFAVLGVLFVLGVIIFNGPDWTASDPGEAALADKYERETKEMPRPARTLTEALGYGLMSRYLLPFEAISVLLLAALIGAAFLARKEVKS